MISSNICPFLVSSRILLCYLGNLPSLSMKQNQSDLRKDITDSSEKVEKIAKMNHLVWRVTEKASRASTDGLLLLPLGLLLRFAQLAATLFVNMRRFSGADGCDLERFILKVGLVQANKLKEYKIRPDHRGLTITELHSKVSWIC